MASHTIYQTDGIVLGRKNFGEADSFFYVLTKKFGLVQATSQGVRYLKSKLRYNLDLLSAGNFSLVRGRNNWRIVDVSNMTDEKVFIKNKEKNSVLARIGTFLIRMLKGEEGNEFIWNEFFSLAGNLQQEKTNKKNMSDIEILTMARILNNLGYIEQEIESIPRQHLVEEINRAIKESML